MNSNDHYPHGAPKHMAARPLNAPSLAEGDYAVEPHKHVYRGELFEALRRIVDPSDFPEDAA